MTQQDKTPSAATEEAKPKNWRRHALIYALLAVLALSQIALASYVWFALTGKAASLPTSADNALFVDQIEALTATTLSQKSQLQTLQTQLDSLQMPDGSSNLEALERFNVQQQTLGELQARIDALEQAQPKQLQGEIASWRMEEIAKAAKDMRQLKVQIERDYADRLKDIQLLTAFDRLQERIMAEESYDQALAAFKVASEALSASKEWVTALKPSQMEGMASWSQLQEQFESARLAATEAQQKQPQPTNVPPSKGAEIWQTVRSNLSSLITIRKTGNTHQGSDMESVLARAAFALQQQDEEGIAAELAMLTPEQRAFFAEFEASLATRQSLYALLNEIRLYLDARLQQPVAVQ